MNLLGLLDDKGIEYNRSASTDDFLNELNELMSTMSVDTSKTAYIVSEKQSFRTDSLCTALRKEYTVDLICLNKDSIPIFGETLFFLLDITNFTLTKFFIKSLNTIQDVASQNNIPIFILGEQEDILNIKSHLKKSEINFTFFQRPIIIQELLDEINSVLLTMPLKNRKKHIAVVDDNLTFLKIVEKNLEKDYRVTTAFSAIDFIKKIANLSELPDLFLIDYLMPTCDGLTLCKMLREDKAYKNIPIVFLSGNNDVNDMIKLMPMIDGYMLKSSPITDLGSYIQCVFEKIEKEKNFKESKYK